MNTTMLYLFLSILGNMFLFYVVGYMYSINRSLKKKQKESKPAQIISNQDVVDIMGKTKTSFFAPISEPENTPDPVPVELPETEPEILPEDVEHKVNKLEKEEVEELTIYLGHNEGSMEDVGELNQGLTFEEIGHAIDLVKADKREERDVAKAGKTFALMPQNFVDVICSNSMYSERVDALIKTYVEGSLSKKSSNTQNFRIEDYV